MKKAILCLFLVVLTSAVVAYFPEQYSPIGQDFVIPPIPVGYTDLPYNAYVSTLLPNTTVSVDTNFNGSYETVVTLTNVSSSYGIPLHSFIHTTKPVLVYTFTHTSYIYYALSSLDYVPPLTQLGTDYLLPNLPNFIVPHAFMVTSVQQNTTLEIDTNNDGVYDTYTTLLHVGDNYTNLAQGYRN